MTDRRSLQTFHPFARLNGLLAGVEAGRGPGEDGRPLVFSLGEPQTAVPAFALEELARHSAAWSRYPPPRGTEAYRGAAAGWLQRRYALPEGFIDPERHLLPLPGSREGLFFAALATIGGETAGKRRLLLPNPFYHVYAGAAAAAGAVPTFAAATPASGFLPDYEALPPEVLQETALAYFCSPSNPQGAVAEEERLARLIALARRYGFVVAFDECYSEIYADQPPAGALAAAARSGSLDAVLAFHSLSKRSGAAGLRCGFVAGEAKLIDALDGALRVGGAGVPLPVLAAGARLWSEESHVEANRALYRRNFALAERILGNRFGFTRPAGGFFLWLDVGDGEAAALRLWREGGLKTLPGGYMATADAEGVNPAAAYLRVALVHDAATTEQGLGRLVEVLHG